MCVFYSDDQLLNEDGGWRGGGNNAAEVGQQSNLGSRPTSGSHSLKESRVFLSSCSPGSTSSFHPRAEKEHKPVPSADPIPSLLFVLLLHVFGLTKT